MTKRCFYCNGSFYPVRSDQLFCCKRCQYKYHHQGDMVLTLKKKWFDMILNGIKTEEYREIKPYWEKRFGNYFGRYYNTNEEKDCDGNIPQFIWSKGKKIIKFRNGYSKTASEFTAECSISEGYGKSEWGAEPGVKYYVLKIHRVL